MAAASKNRDGARQPGELVSYNGASGYTYYKNTLLMKDRATDRVIPLVTGTGASNAKFIGVVSNRVDLSEGLGASNTTMDVWKTGIFSFVANGTGATVDIGSMAYGIDDQTVGNSCGVAGLPVGEITGLVSTSVYRVRIDNAICLPVNSLGVSWDWTQN